MDMFKRRLTNEQLLVEVQKAIKESENRIHERLSFINRPRLEYDDIKPTTQQEVNNKSNGRQS